MHRREFLGGVAGATVVASAGIETAAGHAGPYRPLGSVDIANAKEAVPDPKGGYAYVATTDGFAVVDLAIPSEPQVVAERTGIMGERETGPLRDIYDVKVEGDRLVAAGPANPIQGDVLQGFALFDVSDPKNPKRVGFHETTYPIHNCFIRDKKVYLTGNHASSRPNGGTKNANPLVIVDVSGDDPTEIARWSLLSRDKRWGKVPSGIRTIHDVWVGGGRAYLAHWDAGTYILDVSDPKNPTYVTRLGGRPIDELLSVPKDAVRAHVLRPPGNAHYAMPNDDGSLVGVNKEAWEAEGKGGPGGLDLWDVSNPKNPKKLSTIDAPPSPDPQIGGTWTTSHNFDIVGERLFTSWYQGGVKVHDISDPANPKRLTWWRQPQEASFWTAKRVKPRFFIASSYGRRNNGRGGLYVFPNHAGQQKDAPPLTTTGTGNGTGTGSNASSGSATTKVALSDDQTTTRATTESSGGSGGVPGFGIPATLAALLGAGAWRKFRK
ncbi:MULTISPECIES: LVIVD repeat-containing protein [Halorussus]|uniref:LVIVD repeat-containing protein n=1 Tax=Halorussus TaxID=1070314 RepID=UPI00209E26D7|nr:hypothetical protein [Halorussus vallis]USZ74782.1 hypothetical protein NGM07_15230 [Halorussus vallis]